MNIGVDAGAICETDDRLKVGVYRITLELLRHLATLDTANFYRLYSFSPIPRPLLQLFGNRMVNIPFTPSTGYMRVRLPLHLALHPVDIFLGLSQAMPVGVKHGIGFVYDLGFLHVPAEYGSAAARLKKQTEETVARSHHIVTISNASKKDIAETYHVDAKRITVALPGVSDVFRNPGEEKHHTHPYFLSVGLLKPGKRIPLAIRAFAQFLQTVKTPYDFVIIGGDTNADPEIRKTIRELHMEKRVILTGFLPDAEVASWYRGAEGMIALSTHEGFCLPAAEALACGCPVIYASAGALPEIVGHAGIPVREQDETHICTAMEQLVRHGEKKNLRIRAMEQSKHYRWESFAQQVLGLLSL